jgi:ribosomal protein S18 acetylase RimI-like enzyme
MPKIRRQNLPPALLDHLLDRIRSREISADQLGLFADWLDSEPEVPSER